MRRFAPFLLLPALAVAGPASADIQRRTCVGVKSPIGVFLTVETQNGPSCVTGRNTIKAYYRKAKAGNCIGNGCATTVGRYRCRTNTAGAEKSTGYSTICALRGRPKVRIVTLTI